MSKLQEENLGILRSRILFTTPLTCWLSFTCTLCTGRIHPTTVSSVVDHHRPSSSSSPSLSSSSSSVSPECCWSCSILFENQAIPRVVEIEKQPPTVCPEGLTDISRPSWPQLVARPLMQWLFFEMYFCIFVAVFLHYFLRHLTWLPGPPKQSEGRDYMERQMAPANGRFLCAHCSLPRANKI